MSGLEGVATLALLCNILDVAKLAYSIVAKGKEVYDAGSDPAQQAIEKCATSLLTKNAALKQSIEENAKRDDCELDDLMTLQLARACNKEASKLIDTLSSVRIHGSATRIDAMRTVVKMGMKKDEINAIRDRMEEYQKQISARLIQDTNLRQKVMADQQSEAFQKILSRGDQFSEQLQRMQYALTTQQGAQTQTIVNVLTAQHKERIAGRAKNAPPPYEQLSAQQGKEDILNMIQENKINEMRLLITQRPHLLVQRLDEKGQTALHAAAASGNLDAIKFLVMNDRSIINVQDHSGSTALHLAVNCSSKASVRWLMFQDADPNIRDANMKTALDYAGRADEIPWILKYGHDIEAKNEGGYTALLYFIAARKPDVIQSLLKEGAQVNYRAPDGDHDTPLTMAALMGMADVVELLLKHGAEVNLQSNRLDTGLTNAARCGHLSVVQKLLEYHADINIINKMSYTAAMEAAFHTHEEIAVLLIELGTNLDQINHVDRTIIQVAAEAGAKKSLQAILKRNPKLVNVKSPNADCTPLQEACFRNHDAYVEILLEYGASVHIRNDKHLQSPLHLAAISGNARIIRMLVERGRADIEARDKNAKTPLLEAIRTERIDAVRTLIALGADVECIELIRACWTPLVSAVNTGNREIVRIRAPNKSIQTKSGV